MCFFTFCAWIFYFFCFEKLILDFKIVLFIDVRLMGYFNSVKGKGSVRHWHHTDQQVFRKLTPFHVTAKCVCKWTFSIRKAWPRFILKCLRHCFLCLFCFCIVWNLLKSRCTWLEDSILPPIWGSKYGHCHCWLILDAVLRAVNLTLPSLASELLIHNKQAASKVWKVRNVLC